MAVLTSRKSLFSLAGKYCHKGLERVNFSRIGICAIIALSYVDLLIVEIVLFMS